MLNGNPASEIGRVNQPLIKNCSCFLNILLELKTILKIYKNELKFKKL